VHQLPFVTASQAACVFLGNFKKIQAVTIVTWGSYNRSTRCFGSASLSDVMRHKWSEILYTIAAKAIK